MRKGVARHSISGVFVFLLLGIFAVLATGTVGLGAKAYRETVERAEAHNSARTAVSYLRSMLRAEDVADALRVETEQGVMTIALHSEYDDEAYVTRIYVYNGMLMEWFTEAEEPFEPENGEEVCSAESLSADWKDGVLTVRITAGGTEQTVCYAPRTAGEEVAS